MHCHARLLLLFGILTACTSQTAKPPPEEVTVQLKWLHQAQFAGFYMAKENGYYDEESLKVNFLEGGRDVDIAEPVVTGRAHFGVVAPEDVILKRSEGHPITAIAAIYRQSAVVFLARADSGISRPAHFAGKTVGAAGTSGSVRDFEWQYHALMKRLNLDETTVKLVPYDPDYTDFLSGDIDVTAAFLTSGYLRLRREAPGLILIRPGDYGVHSYSDTLITNELTIRQRPELVTRFLRASLKGWREAIGNPEAAVEATLKYARFPDRSFQTEMMEALMPLVHTGEQHIGWMTGDEWHRMNKNLIDQGLTPGDLDWADCYTMRFLEAVYGGDGR